jgi:Zn ribbon nucleic-acid-binding protein
MIYVCKECNNFWRENEINSQCLVCGSHELIKAEKKSETEKLDKTVNYKEKIEKLRSMLREANQVEDQELIEIISTKINKLGQLKVKKDIKNKTTMQILEKINHDMKYHVPEEIFPVYQIRFDETKKRLENYVETERKYQDLKETAESCSSVINRNKGKLTSGEIKNSDFLTEVYKINEKLQMKLAELENLI